MMAFLGLATLVQAEPLNMKDLSADAKWAAHLDVDALLASTIGKKADQHICQNFPKAKEHLAMLTAVCNFNPATDLHGITIYGTQLKRKTGVAIVHAKVDQNRLLEKALAAPDHQKTAYGKYELHSWSHGKGSKHERNMIGTFFKPDVLVFGSSPDEVKAALDVLDGTKPNFSSKETGLTLSIPSGTFLVAGVTGLSESELPCKSPLAKKTDAVVLAIGEEQGNVFVTGQLMAKDPEISREIKTVLDGGVALAKIMKSDDADLMKLIDAVKVTAVDKAVNVEWRAPADQVWIGVQAVIAKAKKAHAERREHKDFDHCPMGK
jgi:hypothetical protein